MSPRARHCELQTRIIWHYGNFIARHICIYIYWQVAGVNSHDRREPQRMGGYHTSSKLLPHPGRGRFCKKLWPLSELAAFVNADATPASMALTASRATCLSTYGQE